jgi:ribonuclease Z
MTPRFHLQLVNDEFGDPGLYVDFAFEKRALLFDLGDLSALPSRKLLRISDIFVSHMHMDHFCGLDRLLRLQLGREKLVRVYGPPGIIDAVAHKLAAYSWNLVDSFDTELAFRVTEWHSEAERLVCRMRLKRAFEPEAIEPEGPVGNVLLQEEGFGVEALPVDHGLPALAFALRESRHVNIWKNRVTERGLAVGPWLLELKAAILGNAAPDTPIAAAVLDGDPDEVRTLPLAELRELASVSNGLAVVYVVDAAPSRDNIERIVRFAERASHLYIETPFLHADLERARQRRHLTARIAGEIAARAGVDTVVTLHYSPRYEGRGDELQQEAETAFRGLAGTKAEA